MTNLAVEVLAARVEGSNEKGRGDVKRRTALAMLGLVGAVALVASLAAATVGNAKPTASPTVVKQSAAIAAPAVPNAAKLKAKYGGQSITFVGDSRSADSHVRDLALAKRFTKDTGIKVKVVPHPDRVRRVLLAARRAFSLEVVLVRRGDDRRRLAGRVRAVPRRPEAEARQAVEAARAGDRRRTTPSTASSSPCRGSATSGSSTTAPTC